MYHDLLLEMNARETFKKAERNEAEMLCAVATLATASDPVAHAAAWFEGLSEVAEATRGDVNRMIFEARSGALALQHLMFMQVEGLTFESVDQLCTAMGTFVRHVHNIIFGVYQRVM